MNHIEVFNCEYVDDIESTVNRYCEINKLNPLSVSVLHISTFPSKFVVTLVVEPIREVTY